MTKFGEEIKELWKLETNMIFLNHGSYGATPTEVLEVQSQWRLKLETQPCQFVNKIAPREIRAAAGSLAKFLGANGDDLVFVENTTSGINAILRSFPFQKDDEVVVSDHIYNAVRKTLDFVLEARGARLVIAKLGLPVTGDDAIVEAIFAEVTSSTRLILIDHVASATAVKFPVARIAKIASAQDIPVLVDGAHAPGMLDLDVPELGVAWYVGNCHKWLCAPKGSAFLWAQKNWQKDLHPTVISHDLGKGFTFEFDKIGTRDASAWLAVPKAIAFHKKLGGAELCQRGHDVVVEAAHTLSNRWKTETGAPDALFGTMATVKLPSKIVIDRPTAERLKTWLWEEHRAEIHIMPFDSEYWLRLSIAPYNTLEECLKVGPLVEAALAAEVALSI
ncbi:MAG: aminotransferase class V-fold PLP-dependent enzyme [Paracoccaceae bacterium]|nr:aminotransferase class V-fold PLP-dependent enzyme [Paracoccaceae bacterium]